MYMYILHMCAVCEFGEDILTNIPSGTCTTLMSTDSKDDWLRGRGTLSGSKVKFTTGKSSTKLLWSMSVAMVIPGSVLVKATP